MVQYIEKRDRKKFVYRTEVIIACSLPKAIPHISNWLEVALTLTVELRTSSDYVDEMKGKKVIKCELGIAQSALCGYVGMRLYSRYSCMNRMYIMSVMLVRI